ncbi:class I SAM-dependent methyltransferase [Tepidibacillus decaturensis]
MKETWEKVWETHKLTDWDPLSEEIYQILKREVKDFKGKKILEAGSGSGRISLRLALEGAEVTLLDFSEKALEIADNYFSKFDMKGNYVLADLTKSLPFENDEFDLVWNSGVMEHFLFEQQVSIIKEFYRIATEFHTFNPNASSFFYRLGKWFAELSNTWQYGEEFPIITLEGVFKNGGFSLEKEEPIAFLNSLYFLNYIPNSSNVTKVIFAYLSQLNDKERRETEQRLGGYLLYSKGVK